jgi:prepilin-type N-terminal cleavage/methylation domain-containing protein
MHRKTVKKGMTLIELLTVIAIIGILAALLLPAISSTRERGRMAYCKNNLRNISQGLLMYVDEHDDYFPPVSKNGNTVMWDTEIFHYVGESDDVFLCPSDLIRHSSVTNAPRTYAANGGVDYRSQPSPFGDYDQSPEGPARMSDLDYSLGDIILVGERPTEKGADDAYSLGITGTRGHVHLHDFSGLDQIAGTLHRNLSGCQYLMGSMSVVYLSKTEVEGTNYWTIHTQ